MLHETSNLQTVMSSLQDVVGELKIARSTIAGKYILQQLAARFRMRYPGIQVRIPTCASDRVGLDLLDGEVHLGVMSREVADPNLEVQDFFHDKIELILPAYHRLTARTSIEPQELLEKAFIIRESISGTLRMVLEELAKHDISLEDLNIGMELGNGLADHHWTLEELFLHRTPPRPWLKNQGRGRMTNRLKRRLLRYGFKPLFSAVLPNSKDESFITEQNAHLLPPPPDFWGGGFIPLQSLTFESKEFEDDHGRLMPAP